MEEKFKPEIGKIYETNILRLNNEGQGVCKIDEMITFVPYALPNTKVKVKIDRVYKNYAEAYLVSDKKYVLCPYFYKCGGCDLMHINYNDQLNFKKEKIESIFKKICNIDIKVNNIESYNEFNYRNKVVFKVKNNKIGFYKNNTNELIDIEKCIISDNEINKTLNNLRTFINEYPNNDINEVMIRIINNEIMISLDNIKSDIKDIFINRFDYLNSIYINNKNVYGNKYLCEMINDLKFNVSPKSFFQVNSKTTKYLYEKALSYITKSDTILDLYSGTGTISLLAAKKAKNVIGIEVVRDAVDNALDNAKMNNIDNVKFICDKVENKIDTLKNLNIDYIIMDPPRSGSDKKSLNNIIQISPKNIIYISCNPVTLARDYNILKEKYEIKEVTAFDMFPNTYHIESLMVLERKDN